MRNLKVLILDDIDKAAEEVFKRHGIEPVRFGCVLGIQTLQQMIGVDCYHAIIVGEKTEIRDSRIPEIQMIKAIGKVGLNGDNVNGTMLGAHRVPLIHVCKENTIEAATLVAEQMCGFLLRGEHEGVVNKLPDRQRKSGWRHKVKSRASERGSKAVLKAPLKPHLHLVEKRPETVAHLRQG